MKTRIVRLGNSQGIRIPKRVLEQTALRGEVEIHAEGDALVVRPVREALERDGPRRSGGCTSVATTSCK